MTEQWKKEIDDALAVMGGLQARQGRVLHEHSEWLEEHQRAMQRHQEWLQEHDRTMARIEASLAAQAAAGKVTDERIEKLVSAIGEFIRRNGGEKP